MNPSSSSITVGKAKTVGKANVQVLRCVLAVTVPMVNGSIWQRLIFCVIAREESLDTTICDVRCDYYRSNRLKRSISSQVSVRQKAALHRALARVVWGWQLIQAMELDPNKH